MARWWRWFRRNSQATTPANTPSGDGTPQPLYPVAGSDSTPTEQANGADQLEQARQLAVMLLEQREQFPPQMIAALEGLLAKSPTEDDVRQGMAALAAIAAAMETARTEAALRNLPPTLAEWYRTPSWSRSREWLSSHLVDLPPDAPDQLRLAARSAREADDDELAGLLERHADLITEARRSDVATAYRAIIGERAFAEDTTSDSRFDPRELGRYLVTWIQTPDWNASRQYLAEHPDLLTDAAEAVLALLIEAQRDEGSRRTVTEHLQLLRDARAVGIEEAYTQFLASRSTATAPAATEVTSLLTELQALASADRDPARQVEICQRLLALDRERGTLGRDIHFAVLGTLGNAFQSLAKTRSGNEPRALLQAAIQAYDAALDERPQSGYPLDWAMTQNNKGNALQELAGTLGGSARAETLRQALACYDLALLERRQDNAPLNWAMTQNNKGNALLALGRTLGGSARAETLRQALACYDLALRERPLAIFPGEHRALAVTIAATDIALALSQAAASREEEFTRAWNTVASGIQAARALEERAPSREFLQEEWSTDARLYAVAATIQALRGNTDEAASLIESGRARGLAEMLNRRRVNLDVLSATERAEYQDALNRVLDVEAAGRMATDQQSMLAIIPAAEAANSHLTSVRERLQRVHPDFLPERKVNTQYLAASLHRGEGLIYLVPQEFGTLIIAVPRGGPPRSELLTDLTSDDIFALAVQSDEHGYNRLGYLPAAIGWGPTPLNEALDDLLPRLGDRLMRHVVRMAQGLGLHRAVLVPGGMLAVLPLHAATYRPLSASPTPTAPGDRRFACDDLAITFAPSGGAYVESRATAERVGRPRHGLVVSNPMLTDEEQDWKPGTLGYLPFAAQEGITVADLMRQAGFEHVKAVDGADATWKAIVTGLLDCDLAHLAMHAVFNSENPLMSALLVSPNARLFLRDILDRRKLPLTHLRLAVLSACQSGLGDFQRQTEEAIGLFGGLLAAGAAGVIGSLWPVYDPSTLVLMEELHQRYLMGGQEPFDALRNAQRALRGLPDVLVTQEEEPPRQEREVEWTVTIETVEITPESPLAAQRRWAELRDLTSAGTRQLPVVPESEAGDLAAAQRNAPLTHPIHWAAFVYYGA